MTTPEIPAAVYRVFDAEGQSLYIGMTVNPEKRFAQHKATTPWWALVDHARTAVTWFDTRAEAAEAEVQAIGAERPEFNVHGKLTAEQDAVLGEVVEAFRRAKLSAAQAWKSLLEARAAGIPDLVLCRRTDISRATLNRKYGPRTDERTESGE